MPPTSGALAHAIRRFPLVERRRPIARPLSDRIQRLADLAREADETNNGTSAAAVHNLAALLATDQGLPEEARRLCWEHADLYLRARPLSGALASRALEPLVSLASLEIRLGNGDKAFELLNRLADAVTTRADTTLDGHPLPVADFTAGDADHQEVCEWIENVRLYDGTRALLRSGLWEQAHRHLLAGNGIARRLYDGRQIAVIALALRGDTEGAARLLHRTPHEQPWEHAVAAALTVLCHLLGGTPVPEAAALMLDRYRRLARPGELLVFDTRLGLAITDLADAIGDEDLVADAARTVAERTLGSPDGYTAREVLTHPTVCERIATGDRHRLAAVVEAACLGRPDLTTDERDRLAAALVLSRQVITRHLPRHQAATATVLAAHRGPARR